MSQRRQAILEAARTLFLAKGYRATSIAEIRAASGATTGSIYHAFGSKQGIALALLQDALSAWQVASEEAQQSSRIEDVIRSTVEGLIRWAVSDPAAFRLLDHLRSVGEDGHAGSEVLDLLERGRRASREVLKEHADRGEIKIDDAALAQALILGPTYEYLRSLPHGDHWHIPRRHIDRLRDLAWTVVAPAPPAER